MPEQYTHAGVRGWQVAPQTCHMVNDNSLQQMSPLDDRLRILFWLYWVKSLIHVHRISIIRSDIVIFCKINDQAEANLEF